MYQFPVEHFMCRVVQFTIVSSVSIWLVVEINTNAIVFPKTKPLTFIHILDFNNVYCMIH